ncbi:MAG: hypothetical protein ACR2LK_10140, partial [Solirubrobacteraceae bacterium]
CLRCGRVVAAAGRVARRLWIAAARRPRGSGDSPGECKRPRLIVSSDPRRDDLAFDYRCLSAPAA